MRAGDPSQRDAIFGDRETLPCQSSAQRLQPSAIGVAVVKLFVQLRPG
jgi:hypothetical protein